MRNPILVPAAALFWATGFAAPAAADQALGLSPPAPIACPGQACERDPARLADFVVKFYAWYVDDAIADANSSDAARRQHEQRRGAVLDRLLSTGFRAKLAKLQEEIAATPEGDETEPDPSLASLCGGAGADNILCAQDYDGQWRSDAAAKIESSTPSAVRLTVTLPWPADPKTGTPPRPHRLLVTLVPDHGQWRIDRIAAGR